MSQGVKVMSGWELIDRSGKTVLPLCLHNLCWICSHGLFTAAVLQEPNLELQPAQTEQQHW